MGISKNQIKMNEKKKKKKTSTSDLFVDGNDNNNKEKGEKIKRDIRRSCEYDGH